MPPKSKRSSSKKTPSKTYQKAADYIPGSDDEFLSAPEDLDDSIDDAIASSTAGVPALMSPMTLVQTPDRLPPSFDSTADDEDFSDLFRIQAHHRRADGIDDERFKRPKRVTRPPINSGMDYLKHVVGSECARDLRRRAGFMSPESFAEWKQKYDKKNQYQGAMRNVDNDPEEEFVVERFDAQGNPYLVAVNGWTTVKSDYPVRKAWYSANPTLEQRRRNKFKPFLKSHYLTEEYKAPSGYPNHAYLEKLTQDQYDNYKYNLRMPNPKARQEFMKEIIWEAYKRVISLLSEDTQRTKEDISNACNQRWEPGWVARKGAEIYNAWFVEPTMANMRQSQYYIDEMEKYARKFVNSKNAVPFNRQNPEHIKKFEKTLLKRDSVREGINQDIADLINDTHHQKEAAIADVSVKLDAMICDALASTSPTNSPYKQTLRALRPRA